jgi:hypothetical protein
LAEIEEVFTLVITLRSGATVEADVTDANYNAEIQKLDWSFPPFAQSRILHVDPKEIAAISLKEQKRPEGVTMM